MKITIETFDANGALKTAIASVPVHDHTGAGSGGQLNASSVFSAGQVPAARGGNGQDFSGSSGLQLWTSGVASVISPPKRAVMWHHDSIVTVGNAFTIVADASMMYNFTCRQSAASATDAFTNSFWIAAGTYTFSVLGFTSGSSGIVKWEVDGSTVVASQDWYSGGNTYNVFKTASVTISTSGYHTLKGSVNGKNAASADYQLRLMKYIFYPSSD